MEKVEFLILRSLLYNEEYLRKTLPFLKNEYFEDNSQKIVFEEIASFVEQYNDVITKEVLSIEIQKRSDINESSFKEINHLFLNQRATKTIPINIISGYESLKKLLNITSSSYVVLQAICSGDRGL